MVVLGEAFLSIKERVEEECKGQEALARDRLYGREDLNRFRFLQASSFPMRQLRS